MKKYTNDAGKTCYKGVELSTNFSKSLFHTPKHTYEDDHQLAFHSNLGSITVLDRVTGYIGSPRDVESGYRDASGNFWLASGGYDVINAGCENVGHAIEWVKNRANTCIGEDKKPQSVIQNAIKDSQEILNRKIERWGEMYDIAPQAMNELKEIIDPDLVIL